MIFLMYNMGNSGGSWFENVCNSHPKVRAWEEVHRLQNKLHLLPENPTERNLQSDEWALKFIKEKSEENEHETVGLIKSFGPRTEEYCLKNKGKIVQMFRNPVKVVQYKMYKKREGCLYRNKFDLSDKSSEFEAHVELYSCFYQKYINRESIYKTIRLEDLSASLLTDCTYFKEVLEYVTGQSWTSDQVSNIKSGVYPRNKEGFEDQDDVTAWFSWNEKEREVFKKYFKEIMAHFNYRIPE